MTTTWTRARFVAAALLLTLAAAAAAQSPPPLALRGAAPAIVNTGASRDVEVTIANTGGMSVLMLPNMVRLRIDGAGAEYLPYPGPPIDPWAGARALAPTAQAVFVFRDTSDKRGIWRLPPGEYRITARYDVPAELARTSSIDARPLWRGAVESPPATMRIR